MIKVQESHQPLEYLLEVGGGCCGGCGGGQDEEAAVAVGQGQLPLLGRNNSDGR